jgi:hypothetical protein
MLAERPALLRDACDRELAVIAAVQADGTCWCGPTTWHGVRAMRVSVSGWSTTEADVDRSVRLCGVPC